MQNKSVEEREEGEYAAACANSNRMFADGSINNASATVEAFEKGASWQRSKSSLAARQDQGVVGTQGRESFIEKVCNDFVVKWRKSIAREWMNNNWPVSEGEGMNGWISVKDKLPGEIVCCFWCRVPVVEPPLVGSLIDDDFPDPTLEYYTHWKKIENTFFPQPLPLPPQNQK
jgi:hypothetical protein